MSIADVEANLDRDQIEGIREEARLLARENKRSDPHITRVFWFPDTKEVRLIELDATMPRSPGDTVEPFYFGASTEHHLHHPSGIALIRPEEYRQLLLPSDWGTWDDAEELEVDL